MQITNLITQDRCDITFSGTCTFSDTIIFSEVISLMRIPDIRMYIIHIDALEFIDSSGLGMFLLARDAASENQKLLSLSGIKGQVKNIFKLACFEQYFTLIEI